MDRYENAYLEDDLPQPSGQNIVDEEELLAAQAAAEAAAAQQLQQPGGAFNNVGQGLTGRYRDMMMQYWQETINSIEHDEHDFKNHQLPLARIKKVMKTDEDVRMISAEAPILFAKGCDIFITELTMRAWIHAEEHKRRTLQKSDIAAALTKSDMFDFLIDVVPREEEKPKKSYSTQARTTSYMPPSVGVPAPGVTVGGGAPGPSPTGVPHYKNAPSPIPAGATRLTNGIEKDSTNDQFQQQQQQNLLQQHLLQQQMIHQQHLQQQQQQKQNQQLPQETSQHVQGSRLVTPTGGQGQVNTLGNQQARVHPAMQVVEGDEAKPKIEENDSIPNDSDAENYTGFQNFNPVYLDYS